LIAYFDTSALVPLVVEEAGTARCAEQWTLADRVVSVRLLEVEARAVLAQAARQDWLSARQLRSAVDSLGDLLSQLDFVAVDDVIVRLAADLAEAHALRAYDALHLAAALEVADADLVVVAGDHALLGGASAMGLAVAPTS
jgi:predicted nucleic acid-binding protein